MACRLAAKVASSVGECGRLGDDGSSGGGGDDGGVFGLLVDGASWLSAASQDVECVP